MILFTEIFVVLSTEEGRGPRELLQSGVSFDPFLQYHGHPDTGHRSYLHFTVALAFECVMLWNLKLNLC